MGWYVAPCLNKRLAEVNERYPKRSKHADGSIGDTSHQARPSDHNPARDSNPPGCVRARDITHDPTHGCDIHKDVRDPDILKDRRTKYIISNDKIMSYYAIGGYPAYAERPYNGTNAHRGHAHHSIKSGRQYEQDVSPWYKKGVVVDAETKAAIDKLRKETQDDLDAIRDVLGNYGDISKALFSVRRDEDGNKVLGPDGKPIYDETIEVVKDMVSELANTMGELADAVKALAEKEG